MPTVLCITDISEESVGYSLFSVLSKLQNEQFLSLTAHSSNVQYPHAEL